MKDNHIKDLLDNMPLGHLSENELRAIRNHVETCAECERAFQAAQISAWLVKQRADEAADQARNPNPFFQTRVLAAWREQQSTARAWSFRRIWNATGALVASMAATTAALAVLTFVAPSGDTSTQVSASLVPHSAEAVVLDQDQDDNQMTNDQVINVVYVDDDEGR
jgi:hypothetical protein